MRNIFSHIAILLLLSLGNAFAQYCPKVTEALEFFKAKNYENSKVSIESALLDTSCTNNAVYWYFRAFIYKDYYKNKEAGQQIANSRIKAIESARKYLLFSFQSDSEKEKQKQCRDIIHILASSYNHDAAKDLNEQKFTSSFENYLEYMATLKLVQPDKVDTNAIFLAGYSSYMANNYVKAKEYLNKAVELKYNDPNLYYYLAKVYWSTKEKEKSYAVLNAGYNIFPMNKEIILTMVNFYTEDGKLKNLETALDKAIQVDSKNYDLKLYQARVCEKLSETEKNDQEKYFLKAESLYKDVIKSDPNNMRANYNLAILYYNKAVNIIDKMDADSDLTAIDKIQDQCVLIFKQSLPYMSKAYELNPSKKDVLEGLAGIYFALNDMPKSNEFKQKAEAMK